MNILLTGGAGYIGTHTAVQLINAGHSVVIADNFCNSSPEAIKRVETITQTTIPTYDVDVCNNKQLDTIFTDHTIDGVIHFAGLKAVGESVEKPLHYYKNNIGSTLSLLESMQRHNVNTFIFSSSATVYGDASTPPVTEKSPTGHNISNPYGRTKYMIECILNDMSKANPAMSIAILRYFNPIGAHKSGLIGEDPQGIPNNLLPFIAQVAVNKRQEVKVFGNDYDTPDGTGVRDYIHVMDLADGHVAALNHTQQGVSSFNLGTGHGTSVLELIAMFSTACGKTIPYTIVERRTGDIARFYADPSKANHQLQWRATRTVAEACEDSWHWQSQNPHGYKK